MSSSSSQNIQVTIELGHQASFRKKPSPEGYTHDWSVFVRGPEGSKIQHYVEKVVFQLHESFSKPKRVVKEPPYQVSESGYAGFNFPIIIYFRNKESPKKISFDYDLFLNVENSPPINNVRYEKLTFRNPNEEFRLKLLKAGGQPMGNPLALMEPSGTPNSGSKSEISKKIQKTSSSSKDGSLSSSKEKISKHKSSSSVSSSSSKPSTPMSTPVASKDIRSVTPTITPPVAKEHKSRGKEAQKRPSTSSPPDGETSGKKLKRSSSISSDLGKDKHSHKSDKSKNSKDAKDESKKKSKHHKSNKGEKKKDKHKHSSSSSEKKAKSSSSESKSSFSSGQNNKKSSESLSFPSDIPMKTALLSPLKDSSDEDEDKIVRKGESDSVSSLSSDLSSSSSSISLSPLPEAERRKGNTKFDALMAELGDSESLDDDFDDKIPVVPLSHPPISVSKPITETRTPSIGEGKASKKSKSSTSSQSKKSSSKSDKVKSKDSKTKKDASKSSKESKSANSKDRESCEVTQNGVKEESKGDSVAENGETLSSLWELHDRIMASRDSDMLEEVVNIIQETGLFKVTDTSFDFDLCSVDKETVQKIFKCVSSLS